ncbi:type II secretion system F family protein [Cupriavidus plantarum]|uniref:type II secretion system F family protein n=1 Tax=Cupriavidus plantarum TaxID=942865 RepID=UPI000EB4213B|nr:type II secretion system F family protein [Cupriavidus plantarum]RLK39593.1 tight adherence protein C [Cupriavidus plantarum]
MTMTTLVSLSLLLVACAAGLLAWPLLRQWRQRSRAARTIDSALQRQAGASAPAAGQTAGGGVTSNAATAATSAGAAGAGGATNAAHATHAANGANAASAAGAPLGGKLGHTLGKTIQSRFNQRWLESRIGRAVVTEEEHTLLEQCGFYGVRARAVFGALRVALPIVASILAVIWKVQGGQAQGGGEAALTWGFVAFALGFFAPKVWLRRRARSRLAQVDEELPVLIDMLRLLQGVGMSIDQSLQIIVVEFGNLLRVLGPELHRANQQFASGRSREQTLLRIGRLFDSEDLKGLITLLTQVDRHGGGVQEPLRQFGERLQVARKARMKAKIGKLTVKMTGVMVVSLLPVLLIITAGPGFLGAIRLLAQMGAAR